MPDLNDLLNRLKGLRDELESRSGEIAYTTASEAIVFISNRWTDTGTDAKGDKKQYSDNKFSAGLLFRKNKSGKSYEKPYDKTTYNKLYDKAKKGEKISYKDIRKLDGLQTQYKDFKVSGNFWNNIQVVDISQNGVDFEFTIDATDKRNKDILKYTKENQGIMILELSQKELDELSGILFQKIDNIFKKYL